MEHELWAEFEAIEWDRSKVEAIGGSPYGGDCLVAACDGCGWSPTYPSQPKQRYYALDVFGGGVSPEEWAARLGHGAVPYRGEGGPRVLVVRVLVPDHRWGMGI